MVWSKRHFLVLTVGLFSSLGWGRDLTIWMSGQESLALRKMLANISPPGSRRGVVVASPTPLYFKHWIRDSALVMNLVVSLYERARGEDKNYYRSLLINYVELSKENQDNLINQLGEALVYADGTVPRGIIWGAPQHDGPALRAITMTRLAWQLLAEGEEAFVRQWLYDGKIPANSVIKADAEHTLHARGSSYDPWEEERGDIFYVKMVQRKSLLEVAFLADYLGDGGGAEHYRARAKELEFEIMKFWEKDKKRLVCIRNWVEGIVLDKDGLDSSVILGVLHGDTHDNFLPVYHDYVLSTAIQLELMFKELYEINKNGERGTAMGRNRADVWNGEYRSGEGHPWVLITYAFSEYYSRVAQGLAALSRIEINEDNELFYRELLPHRFFSISIGTVIYRDSNLFEEILTAIHQKSDDFLHRVATHADDDGGFSELINRRTGYLQGVKNLTWSCAAAILAHWERNGRLQLKNAF